ncbi:hypothetical protein BDB00DRAFT_868744 [Zychaea mexicana]|uniref:uncharacterized protein n=1 Tax=Zychaea mexicana TaxID=64656 RepID=UPI0022FEC702|nr:uncharacterized protein BDB00DRAFT_868744 [Zychaea mexicana]KAI9497304.1 hypothetical protein BDB00DRAFT_868744 [Zychaea mexicana]
MDATYKTNRHRLPFVNVVGTGSVGYPDLKTFCIAGGWVSEETNVSYDWFVKKLEEVVWLAKSNGQAARFTAPLIEVRLQCNSQEASPEEEETIHRSSNILAISESYSAPTMENQIEAELTRITTMLHRFPDQKQRSTLLCHLQAISDDLFMDINSGRVHWLNGLPATLMLKVKAAKMVVPESEVINGIPYSKAHLKA